MNVLRKPKAKNTAPEIKFHVEKAKLLYDVKSMLGEGPVWDWKKQCLFWVDIEGKKLVRHNPSNGGNQHWNFDEMIGAAVPIQNGNILLALQSGLGSFDFKTKKLTRHGALENTDPQMRYNDGKVGPYGNFWVGSMHKKFVQHSGNLYRVTKDFRSSVQIPETTISNGMAWSSDKKTFYYIDSPTFQVRAYDFDLENGLISNGRTAFQIPEDYGSPDGMCIDTEDMLWIAHWGGSCVRRWNPKTAGVMEKVEVAAPHVTSCCFGGKDLKTLYITSARSGLDKKQLQEFPLSGGLFSYEARVMGTKISYF